MEAHPDDVTAADDLSLVAAARAGDRLAFGILYLRHHAAAWRVACVVSRFSPDAELAVIDGFTRVFSALPADLEDSTAGGVSFRPYLLACVRQSAVERARAAGRVDAPPAPLAGLAPDGELVLSSLEHHAVRGALAQLPERSRTALWLAEVEAMTPAEVAALVGGDAAEVPALVAAARRELHTVSQAARVGHEVRAECRFTVANLEAYDAGTLDPAQGVRVRSHLDDCPTCRMRLGELANGPATLAAAVPAAPLLGGEAQHHWLTARGDHHPVGRWLPPVVAAATPAELPAPARRLVAATAGVPLLARRAGRTIRPAVPVVALVAAWLAVMIALPSLMEPDTAPGPGGLAMPAVQAYVPEYRPGTSGAAPAPAGAQAVLPLSTAESAAPPVAAAPEDEGPVAPVVKLAAASSTGPAAPRRPATPVRPATRPAPAPAPAPAVISAPATVASVTPVVSTLIPTAVTPPARTVRQWQRDLKQRIRERLAPIQPPPRPDVASLRSTAREEPHGRAARRPARPRHTGHAQSA